MRRRNSGGLKTPLIFCVLAGLLFAIFLSPLSTNLTMPASAISTTLGYNLSSDYVAIISGPDGKPIDTTYPIFAYPDSDAVYIQIDRSVNQIVFAESDGGSGPGIMFDSSISPLTINIYRSTEQVNCNERRCQSEIKSTNPLTANGNESIKPLASYVIPDDAVKIVSSRNGNSFVFSTTNASGETTEETVQEGSGAEESSSSASTSCSSAASGLGWLLCPVANFLNAILSMFYSWMEQFLQINPLLFSDVAGASAGLRKAWSTFRNLANVFFAIYILIMIISQITGVGISNYGIKKNLPRVIVSAILLNLSFYLCAATVDITNVIGTSVKELFSSLATAAVPLQQTGIFVGMTGVDWVRGVSGLGILTTAGVAYLITQGATSIGSGIAIAGSGILMGLITILVTSAIAVIGLFLTLAVRQGLVVICVAIAPLAIIFYTLPNTKHLFDRWWKIFKVLILMYPICGFVVGAGAFASRIVLSTGDDLWTVLIASIVQVGPYFVLPSLIHGSINNIGKMQLGRTIGGLANGYSAKAQKALPNAYGLRRITAFQQAHKKAADNRRADYFTNRELPFLQRAEAERRARNLEIANNEAQKTKDDIERRIANDPTNVAPADYELLSSARKTLQDYKKNINPEHWKREWASQVDKAAEEELSNAIADVRGTARYAQGKNAEPMVEELIRILNDQNATASDLVKARAIAQVMMTTKGSEAVLINALYGVKADGRTQMSASEKFTKDGLKKFNAFFQKDQKMQAIMATEDGNLNLLLADLAKMDADGKSDYRNIAGNIVSYDTLGAGASTDADLATIGRSYTQSALKDAQKITAASGDTLKRYKDYISATNIESAMNPANTALAGTKMETLRSAAQYQATQNEKIQQGQLEAQLRQLADNDIHLSEAIRQAGRDSSNLFRLPEGYSLVASTSLNRPEGDKIVRITNGRGDEKLFDQNSGRVVTHRKVTFKDSAGTSHEFMGYDMASSGYRLFNGTDTGMITSDEPVYNPATNLVDFKYKNDTTNAIQTGHYNPNTGEYSY